VTGMLYILISQLGYLAVWSLVFAGGVILLRRGRTNSAMSVLFGSGILMLMQIFYLGIMMLTRAGVIERLAGSRLYAVMWVPQLLGGFLFALGFLQLARATPRET
jgi:hypothetical protein